jgi:hypothetical protein
MCALMLDWLDATCADMANNTAVSIAIEKKLTVDTSVSSLFGPRCDVRERLFRSVKSSRTMRDR